MKTLLIPESGDLSFDLGFSEDDPFSVSFTETIAPVISAELFPGPYEVIPKTENQTLETADKLMSRDMTVKAIPFYKTSNQSGGYTATIAMTEGE